MPFVLDASIVGCWCFHDEHDRRADAARYCAACAGVAMLLCGAAGIWLDKRLGTTPILTILLFLAGGASAVWYGIVSILK